MKNSQWAQTSPRYIRLQEGRGQRRAWNDDGVLSGATRAKLYSQASGGKPAKAAAARAKRKVRRSWGQGKGESRKLRCHTHARSSSRIDISSQRLRRCSLGNTADRHRDLRGENQHHSRHGGTHRAADCVDLLVHRPRSFERRVVQVPDSLQHGRGEVQPFRSRINVCARPGERGSGFDAFGKGQFVGAPDHGVDKDRPRRVSDQKRDF